MAIKIRDLMSYTIEREGSICEKRLMLYSYLVDVYYMMEYGERALNVRWMNSPEYYAECRSCPYRFAACIPPDYEQRSCGY